MMFLKELLRKRYNTKERKKKLFGKLRKSKGSSKIQSERVEIDILRWK